MGFKQFDMGEVFSGKKSGNMITGWDAPTEATPVQNPHYLLPQWAMDIITWLRMPTDEREPLYVYGPTGCGKTSCLKQIASKLNMPVYEITGHSRLEFPELVGHHTVVSGNMQYEYGPLARAMKDGGMFILNEIDLLDPSTAAGLNSVLDGSPLTIAENGGEIIKPHDEFRFVATANSNGAGDATGLYQGILRANLAFMDRFMLVEAKYMTPQREKIVLQSRFKTLPEDLIDKMLDYANHVRRMFIGSVGGEVTSLGSTTSVPERLSSMQLPITMSTRTLMRWAYLCEVYAPLKAKSINVLSYSLDRAIGFRAEPSVRVALHELAQSIFGYSGE